jgi:hypothetical protein
MTTWSRVAALFLLLVSAGLAAGSPQDPVKKAEIERKREEMKARHERRKAEIKADFERRKSEQKAAPAATAAPSRPAAEPKAKVAANSFDEKSKVFRCPEGKFTVFMPVNPRKQEAKILGVQMNMFFFQERDGAYAVAYADLPIPSGESSAKIQERLDGARDGMVRNVNGKLTGESRIFLQSKHPGREVRAELPAVGGILRARVYIAGSRLYQVAVMGLPAWANSEEATRFLNSIAVTP